MIVEMFTIATPGKTPADAYVEARRVTSHEADDIYPGSLPFRATQGSTYVVVPTTDYVHARHVINSIEMTIDATDIDDVIPLLGETDARYYTGMYHDVYAPVLAINTGRDEWTFIGTSRTSRGLS